MGWTRDHEERPWIDGGTLMDHRQLMYDRVLALGGIFTAQAVFDAGSLGGEPPKVRPFVVIRLLPRRTGLNGGGKPVAHLQACEVWIHDDPGSYVGIDAGIDLLRTLANDLVRWEGDSQDLSDQSWQTITKNSTFTLVGLD